MGSRQPISPDSVPPPKNRSCMNFSWKLGLALFFRSSRSPPSQAVLSSRVEKGGLKFERPGQDANLLESVIKPERSSQDTLAYAPQRMDVTAPLDDRARAYASFLKAFPEYQRTWILDTLRRSDFSRLDRTGETYVDYMGGAIYPESLVHVHTDFLKSHILGNTHSVSNRCVFLGCKHICM
jgi:hypothetical protein